MVLVGHTVHFRMLSSRNSPYIVTLGYNPITNTVPYNKPIILLHKLQVYHILFWSDHTNNLRRISHLTFLLYFNHLKTCSNLGLIGQIILGPSSLDQSSQCPPAIQRFQETYKTHSLYSIPYHTGCSILLQQIKFTIPPQLIVKFPCSL